MSKLAAIFVQNIKFKKLNVYIMKTIRNLILLFLLTIGNSSFAQYSQDTIRVLFSGNSYTHFSNMPHLVSLISDSTRTKLVTTKSVAGGVRLSEHWRGEKNLKTMDLIKTGKFDVVVLQEQSMGTIEQADSFAIYAQKLCNFIEKNGAKPCFYETWAREKVPQYQKIITREYATAAEDNDALLATVGEAWALAQQLRPGIELYAADGSHPSDLGAFLTACVFVATLTGEIPYALPNRFSITDTHGEKVWLMSIHPLDVTFCLKVVEELTK